MQRLCIQGNGEIYFGTFSVSLVYGRKAIGLENIHSKSRLGNKPMREETPETCIKWELQI